MTQHIVEKELARWSNAFANTLLVRNVHLDLGSFRLHVFSLRSNNNVSVEGRLLTLQQDKVPS